MREFLYRILPDKWVPYLLHTRPRAWPIVTAHMTVGFILANGLQFDASAIKHWLLAALAWGILGNGGTLAINSVYDKDEGDIGYLDNRLPCHRVWVCSQYSSSCWASFLQPCWALPSSSPIPFPL